MTVSPAETVSSAPVWSNVTGEIACPLCGYNLRGLREPRCPECGHHFVWENVLRVEERHPYLFEHATRGRIRSLCRTLAASFLPRRFWRSVRPAHRPVIRRLVIYAGALVTLNLFAIGGVTAWQLWNYWSNLQAMRNAIAFQQLAAPINRYYPWQWSQAFAWAYQGRYWPTSPLDAFTPVMATVLVWPWLTLATLHLFRLSLRKARIKRGHVLRCVVYSADVVYLGTPLLMGLAIAFVPGWNSRIPYPLSQYAQMAVAVFVLGVLMLLWTYRLWTAYRHYLGFPHAFATVIASQAIVGLLMSKAWLWWEQN